MDALTRAELTQLMTVSGSTCVSFFMPTHREGTKGHKNLVQFRNLLRQTERMLEASGIRARRMQALLEPARELAKDTAF